MLIILSLIVTVNKIIKSTGSLSKVSQKIGFFNFIATNNIFLFPKIFCEELQVYFKS